MTEWNGQERRLENNVRLALLEKSALDTERRHAENKQALQALALGIESVIDKTDAQTKIILEKMEIRGTRITAIETTLVWFERALYGMGTVGIMVASWIFHHSQKATR